MKTLIILLFIIFLTGVEALPQEQQPVPYTLADRDRLIKVETEIGSIRNEMNSIRSEMNSLRNEMNAKFESIDKQFVYQQKQIDDLKTLYYWGFGNYYYSSCFYDGIHDMVSTYSLETSPNKC